VTAPIRIEPVSLTPANQLAIGHAHTECFPDDAAYIPSKGHWWIARAGKHLAGFAGIQQSHKWFDTGYLCRAGVLPEFRGQGLQKRLIRVRLAAARRLGWKWVVTDTRQNPASANSLIDCGFRMFTPSDPWSFKDACYWRIRLTS
jgi:GNAT superfamily N-acetyltransferase